MKGYEWIDAVLRHSRAEMGDRLLLVAIAARANDAGECFPSQADLCRRTRLSRRGLQYATRNLEALGELATQPGRGRGHTTLYRLAPNFAAGQKAHSVRPLDPGKGANDDQKRRKWRPEKAHVLRPEPNIEQTKNRARARALQLAGRARAEPDPEPPATRPLDLFHEALARVARDAGRAPPARLDPPAMPAGMDVKA